MYYHYFIKVYHPGLLKEYENIGKLYERRRKITRFKTLKPAAPAAARIDRKCHIENPKHFYNNQHESLGDTEEFIEKVYHAKT